jgi:hypothetical protein
VGKGDTAAAGGQEGEVVPDWKSIAEFVVNR